MIFDTKLRDRIIADFPSAPLPSGAIVSPAVDGRLSIEADYVEKFFRGKKWTDIKLSSLNKDYPGDPSACLLFMNLQGYSYYLPAYIIICLEHGVDADTIFLTTIWRLTLGYNNQDQDWMSERYSHLNEPKRQDIARFLLVMSDYCEAILPVNDAKIALDSYWHGYLSG